MLENIQVAAATPPKSILGSSTFSQRRDDIVNRITQYSEQCKLNYKGRKELASEKDEIVADLCEAFDEAFNYGLRQQNNFVVTAASLFQNMHEIVTGNTSTASVVGDTTFWDFCEIHLTAHERERFVNLKNVWTKPGRGKAFLRASLNENSLQRYLLTWLSDKELLNRYYTPWSVFFNEDLTKCILEAVKNLDDILFALTIDAIELNKATRTVPSVAHREEPIIYAPSPVPVANSKGKRKTNVVELLATNSTDDLFKNLRDKQINGSDAFHESYGFTEAAAHIVQKPIPTADPIGPELEFLKQPLPDIYVDNHTELYTSDSQNEANTSVISKAIEQDFDDKSDSSSQYSKSSSANDSGSNAALEEKLQEMTDRYSLLETRVAQLTLENRQLLRRLTRIFNDSGIDPTSSFATNFLITIPTVKLVNEKKATSRSYYTYEVHITMRHRLEHWSVLRRYSEFYKLHQTLLRTHPVVANVEFPPKKHFGNKNIVFVEERRQQLQIYLLNLVESLPQVEACKTKADLQKVFPFLRER